MHAPERVLGAGQRDRLLGLARQVVLLDREPEVRIRLAPDRRISPVVALLGGSDEREPAVVGQRAVEHLDRIVVVLEADAVAVVAGGGDLEQQRLAAGAGRGLQHIDHVARAVGVQLVDDRAVDVEAVHRAGVGGQRHEARGGGGDVQIVDQDADPAFEGGRRADHALGLVEHDARLVAAGGSGVDLGALFTVGDQEVEADPGRERALAVLPWHGAVGGAKASETVRALPAEQAADHEGLPEREVEGLAGPLPLAVAQEAKELDRVAPLGHVEPEPSSRGRGQILEMTLAGQTHEAVRENVSLGHGVRIGGDRIVSCRPSHGLAGTLRTSLRASARRPGSACASSGSCRARRRCGP